jgi:hypothetical protein
MQSKRTEKAKPKKREKRRRKKGGQITLDVNEILWKQTRHPLWDLQGGWHTPFTQANQPGFLTEGQQRS